MLSALCSAEGYALGSPSGLRFSAGTNDSGSHLYELGTELSFEAEYFNQLTFA